MGKLYILCLKAEHTKCVISTILVSVVTEVLTCTIRQENKQGLGCEGGMCIRCFTHVMPVCVDDPTGKETLPKLEGISSFKKYGEYGRFFTNSGQLD